jgi:preprotein translocase SecE subunit
MAKTRAQRKAERRRREAQASRRDSDGTEAAEAQHRTQVPESADVVEAELAEQGADLIELASETAEEADAKRTTEAEAERTVAEAPPAPAPSRADVGRPTEVVAAEEEKAPDRISRRERKREERERARRAKESVERRQRSQAAAPERQRGRVIGFLISCWAELKRVQWPDRETLIQASAVTILFIAIAAAYLGALDTIFNFLVQHLL